MLNIEEIKPLIVERLKSLQPNKIILFGSYAYGVPNEESDIDLFITKNDLDSHTEAKAMMQLRDLMKKYKIGFDILCSSEEELSKRLDPFYKIDILQKGIKIYG